MSARFNTRNYVLEGEEIRLHNEQIDRILNYINLNNTKLIGLQHWKRLVGFLLMNIGAPMFNVRIRLRTYVGVGYRYLDEYIEALIEWGILEVRGGIVERVEVPCEDKVDVACEDKVDVACEDKVVANQYNIKDKIDERSEAEKGAEIIDKINEIKAKMIDKEDEK